MMIRRDLLRSSATVAVAVIGGIALVGCRKAPLYSAQGASFAGPGSMADRATQIKRAGVGLGWVMQDVRPGLIRGVLNVRSHQAVVDIPFDIRTFSVLYVSSVNLDYENGEIHSNYNSWVQNLERAIIAQSSVPA
jgi:hypothetical protein